MLNFNEYKFLTIYSFIIIGLLGSGCTKFSTQDAQSPQNLGLDNGASELPIDPDPADPLPPRPGANCGSVSLLWTPNTESDLAGYKIYMGTRSGTYSTQIDVGNLVVNANNATKIMYPIPKLNLNLTYYFVLTAYDIAGNESKHSAEISKTISVCP
ncbi:MAG: hypothetical protein AABY64_12070 [Bdellovibrionota bacterium]